MEERFLAYIWQYRLLKSNIVETDQHKIQIVDPGEINNDAGPDFFNAKIKIDQTLWAGNVEIHVKASDWYHHKHQNDPAYDNIILHVVYENDLDDSITRKNRAVIPALELKNQIHPAVIQKYNQLIFKSKEIPCKQLINNVPNFTINHWLERLLVERMEEKTKNIYKSFRDNKNDWEETLYQTVAKNFGLKVNMFSFELLAKSLPQKILARHKQSLFQLEALLFGQAGFLGGAFNDDYPNQLQKEYAFLAKKYNLSKPLEKHIWKFARLRPANFPTVRIAQLAGLIHQSAFLFSKIIEILNITEIINLFFTKTSSYWENHFSFDKASEKRSKNTGKKFVELLIINAIAPILFLYGKERKNEQLKEKAFDLLLKLPPESNAIIRKWNHCNCSKKNAFHTQALIELTKNYCMKNRCLDCGIGHKILRH